MQQSGATLDTIARIKHDDRTWLREIGQDYCLLTGHQLDMLMIQRNVTRTKFYTDFPGCAAKENTLFEIELFHYTTSTRRRDIAEWDVIRVMSLEVWADTLDRSVIYALKLTNLDDHWSVNVVDTETDTVVEHWSEVKDETELRAQVARLTQNQGVIV